MAADADEKTEPATPRRRQQAREKGQVARSQDLSAAVALFGGFLAMYLLGPALWLSMLAVVKTSLTPDSPTSLAEVLPSMGAAVTEVVKRLVPFLLILFAAVLGALLAQVGFLLSFHPLLPSLNKINPLTGLKRLFSIRMVMMAVTNLGKLLVVTAIAYLTLAGNAAPIIYGFILDFRDGFRLGAALTFELGMRLAAALLILALLDLAWQRYKHEKDLRMSKEEVKDEFRSMEGDPKVKHRRRQIQLQLALQRIRKDVPAADVVVTNPTHVAVAIRYDSESMVAPKVVAKGGDHLALRIRQVAMEFGVPVVQRPPLARALYENVEVGDYIPERFYQAIAEILAFVYELAGRFPVGSKRRLTGTE